MGEVFHLFWIVRYRLVAKGPEERLQGACAQVMVGATKVQENE